MLCAIIGRDAPNSQAPRRAAHVAHMARLHDLATAGRLANAGPLLAADGAAPTGSLIIADFESLAVAQAWFADDPFVIAGVYAEIAVYPYRQVLPAPSR
jgi:uncharacterized protein YciI